MPTLRGVDLIVGLAKATTWGTPVAVGANKGFRPITFSWEDEVGPLSDASFNADRVYRQRTNVGRIGIKGSFELEVKYEGLSLLWALLTGTAGVPTGANPYTHRWFRKIDMTGLFGTLCWQYGGVVHEADSVKLLSATLTAKAGEKLRAKVDWRGRKRSENSATNPNLSSLTEPSTIGYVHWVNSVIDFQVATQGGTLTTLEMNSWDLTWNNNYEDGDIIYTSEYMREPSAGEAMVTGTLTTPAAGSTYLAAALAGTMYEAKLRFNAGASTQWGPWLPSMKLTKVTQALPGRATVPETWAFECHKALSAPSGFAQAVPYIEVVNTESADPLA
jgi:hypothetical protein